MFLLNRRFRLKAGSENGKPFSAAGDKSPAILFRRLAARNLRRQAPKEPAIVLRGADIFTE